jgi:hypothetical protein
MQPRITDVLIADHQRLGTLLSRAYDGDRVSYDEFRGGLLRHIGIEEKILLPALRATGYQPPIAAQLHLDHSALVAMLVPTPSTVLLARIRTLLAEHDPLEEAAGGLYPLADELIGDVDAVLVRIMQAPVPPMARHFDGTRAFEAIELLTTRAAEGRARPPE